MGARFPHLLIIGIATLGSGLLILLLSSGAQYVVVADARPRHPDCAVAVAQSLGDVGGVWRSVNSERLRARIAACLLAESGGDLVAVELLEVVGEHHQPPLGSD
jgi:hypothetical protein